MPELPRGTVTFLFTDIAGSTALWERDRQAMAAAVERQLAILHSLITAHHGVLYKIIGDGTQAAFASAEEALRAAVACQRALLAEDWADPPGPLQVRMALHAGMAEPQDGDYLAASLNRLARLLDAAHGEQILLSSTVAGLAREALPEGVTLKALGEYRLRDILQPEEIFQLCHPALRADFPPLNTPGHLPHNLPTHPTPFLGREQEIEDVVALLLRPDVRLVTLTGPGGVGKTRLALRVAAELLESFPAGAFMVDLARLTDPDLVPSATATALGLREQPGQSLEQTLAEYLRERQLLLLFDNFEHVLPAATFVAELLASAPELKVMVTSRARLELQAEYEYRVDPLPIPDQESLPPLEGLKQYDAIALFVARAQALRPVFTLTAQNATAVAEIVCRLDGLPLAIELAAARIKLLSPEALLPRLERRLPTLAGGARDLPARQRTLRDTIAWSHDLLHPGEQVLFRRLSVFVGGWTLEGAEAMAPVGGGQPIDALDGLTALVDQSLADQRSLEGVVAQEPRYRMLETIREFARERLVESGEEASIQQAFEQFLLGLIEQAQTGIQGPKQITWLGRLDEEHANIRAALGSALERGDSDAALRIAPPLWEFWRVRGYAREGRDWLERAVALASSADTAGFAAAEFGLGKLSVELGDWAAAEAHYRKSLDAYRRLGSVVAEGEVLSALAMTSLNRRAFDDAKMLGEEALTIAQNASDQRGGATALRILGMIAREQGEYERALELFEESMALGRALGDPAWTARVTYAIGITHRLAGHPEKAQSLLDESRALHAALGDRYGLAVIATESGHLAFDAGDVKRAVAPYEESLRHYDSLENPEGIVEAIEALATAAAAVGEADSALRLFGSAEAAREALRLPPRFESDEKRVAAGIELAKRAAGDHAAAAWAAGKSLSLERARDEALELAKRIAGPTNVEP